MTAKGKSCRAWAVRDSDPPTCAVHGGKSTHKKAGVDQEGAGRDRADEGREGAGSDRAGDESRGLYGQYYTVDEIAELVEHAMEYDLEDEIAALRVRISRIMKQLEEEITGEEYARLTDLQIRASGTIARLMRAQRAISGEAAEGFSGAIGQAMDELSNEWSVDL